MVNIKGIELKGRFYDSDLYERIKSNTNEVVLFDDHDERLYLDDLVGELISFEDKIFSVESEENEIKIFEVKENDDIFEGALPQESTVKQLEKIRKKTKSVTIDDKVAGMSKKGANLQYYRNPIDTGIQSYQDFERKGRKKFKIKDWKKYKPYPIDL
ncbi:hypothetical protein EBU94_02280 [bacterium]|nr:hypothetical protein [bacterium]